MKDSMNDAVLRGGYQPSDSDYQRMAENQKMLLNKETQELRDYMNQFREDMMRLQEEKGSNSLNPGQGYTSQGRSGEIQMQQISNVFYNMLNMMGKQQNDQRLIDVSNNLREMI